MKAAEYCIDGSNAKAQLEAIGYRSDFAMTPCFPLRRHSRMPPSIPGALTAAALAGFSALASLPEAAAFERAIPSDPDLQCWRAALHSFQDQGRFTPALTLEPAPGASTLAFDYRVRIGKVRMGAAIVNGAPVADIAPRQGRALIHYYSPQGARLCVIPHQAFADPEFVDLWNHAPVRLRLAGGGTLRYNVSSAIDYRKDAPDAVSIPHKAPYRGAGCDQSNMHTHGLLVRPNAPADPATGTFGDYVLMLAGPTSSTSDACVVDPGSAPDGGHIHPAIPLMRHRVYIPPTPHGAGGDWLKLHPGAPSLHPAGLFFFHPHPHGYSAMQLSGATSAMLTIGDMKHAPTTPGVRLAQNVRHILLRDMQTKATAKPDAFNFIAEAKPDLCQTGSQSLADNKGFCSSTDGRRWFFTVNGQVYPLIDDIRAGEQEVWRVVNASPTVSYRLSVGKIDAGGAAPDADKLELQLLTVDGAASQMISEEQQKFPRNILLMPGARVEFAINAPKGGGEYQLFTDTVETGGDTWSPIALARVHWPASAPQPALAEQAMARETTGGGKQMAQRYDNFIRVSVKGPQLAKPTPPNPAPHAPINAACRDLTGRTHERVVHFVKNPDVNVGGKDLFGLITGIRKAGDVDPASPHALYFRHKYGDAPDVQTNVAWDDVKQLNAPGSKGFTPAFGQDHDASTICATLQRDETYSEIWVIENWTNEIHNFHLHQSKFTIYPNAASAYLSIPCKAQSDGCNATDKLLGAFYEDTSHTAHDTVPVPRGVGPNCNGTIRRPGPDCDPGRISIEVRFGRPQMIGQHGYGDFVFHCHILEHEDRGMMGMIRVIDPRSYKPTAAIASARRHH